jgi:hypothetical protein
MLKSQNAKGRLRCGSPFCLVFLLSLALPLLASGQTWKWTSETADVWAKFTSLAVDKEGNIHVGYAGDSGSVLKYAFRPAASGHWFIMALDKQLQDFATSIGLDAQGNPHLCYTPRELKYAQWNGKKWDIQQIAPGTGSVEYNCTVSIGSDGTSHVIWYHTRSADGANFLHLKYATLEDGVWMARTVDFDGEDGKWNSMVLDAKGYPQLLYSVFPRGELKYAVWDGKDWIIQLSARPSGTASAGMGNSLVLNAQGEPEFSYYETSVEYGAASRGWLKFARRKGNSWASETVDTVYQRGSWVGFRSSLVLDKQGFPHISYEDFGALKHAYWDGTRWQIQVVSGRAGEPYLYSSMAIDTENNLYISYRDPSDGSLKVAIGRYSPGEASTTALHKDKKN